MDKAEANGKTDLQVNIFQTQKGGRLSGIDLIGAGEGYCVNSQRKTAQKAAFLIWSGS